MRRLSNGNTLVIVAALVLIAASWRIYHENHTLRALSGELLAARSYPYVLSGFKPALMEHSKLLSQWPADSQTSQPPLQILVLAYSDSCGFCERNVKKWEQLLQQTQWKSRQEVWFITFDTSVLADQLSPLLIAKGVHHKLFHAGKPQTYSVVTGITGVPLTMVLGHGGEVRLVSAGELSDEVIRVFTDHLNNGNTQVAQTNPFLHRGETISMDQLARDASRKE